MRSTTGVKSDSAGRKTSSAPLQSPSLNASGKIELADGQTFHVHTMLPGRLSQDNAPCGKYFHKGETLAIVESPDLLKISADYLSRLEHLEMAIRQNESECRLAQSDLDRIRKLVKEGIAAEKELTQAQEKVLTNSQNLEDLNEQLVRLENECKAISKLYGIKLLSLKQESAPSELLLKAPISGIVVAKNAHLGDLVNTEEAAYLMASIDKVKLSFELPEAEKERVAIGQKVSFSIDQGSEKTYYGKVNMIKTPESQSNKRFSVSVIFNNPNVRLKPGMTGQVKLFLK